MAGWKLLQESRADDNSLLVRDDSSLSWGPLGKEVLLGSADLEGPARAAAGLVLECVNGAPWTLYAWPWPTVWMEKRWV